MADDATPVENEPVTLTVSLSNQGPHPATTIRARATLPSGLGYVSHQASAGVFVPGTGIWTVDSLNNGASATLSLTAAPATGSAGSSFVTTVALVSADQADTVAANDSTATSVTAMAPVVRVVSGSYVGNGSASRAIGGVGFQPDLVFIKGSNASQTVVRAKPMVGNAAKELGSASALVAGRITALSADGFSVGNDAAVNQNGVTYYWTAFLELPGTFKVGSYSGNGSDNRNLTGVGFQPSYVMVLGGGATAPVQRFGAQSGDATLTFVTGAEVAGSDPEFRPRWLPARSGGGGQRRRRHLLLRGLERGGGTERTGELRGRWTRQPQPRHRRLPSPAPVVKRQDSSAAMWRNQAVSGDLTLPATAAAPFADAIQRFETQGFQSGSDPSTNAATRTYYYAAFRDGLGADLAVDATVARPTANEGDSLDLTLAVTNHGPGAATGISMTESLPAGLTLLGSAPSQGSYTAGTGVWIVGNLAQGATATLVLTTRVDAGTAGQTLRHVGSLTASSPTDLFSDNNSDTAAVMIQLADLAVTVTADDATPIENEPVTFTVSLSNQGPHPASGISARATLPAGLSYLSSQTNTGVFMPGTGIWTVDSLSSTTATLSITAAPGTGSAGSIYVTTAKLLGADQADTVAMNDSAAVSVTVKPPIVRVVSGSYVGNGSASRAIGGVGFQPDLVFIKGSNASQTVVRAKPMVGNAAKELGAASALVPGRITALSADGFSVGNDAAVNQTGVTYTWTAFLEMPGQMKVASYGGNGNDNRSVTGLGFQPGYVMVMGGGATASVQRFGPQSGDVTLTFATGPQLADRIQGLEADGFQVGQSADVNGTGATYYYVAWSAAAGLSGQGSYTGDGSDNRSIAAGFRPQHLWIKRQDGITPSLWRNQAVTGDVTLPAIAAAPIPNAIQRFETQGFQSGSDPSTNAAAQTYYYAAFRDGLGADLAVNATVERPTANEGDTLDLSLVVTNHAPGIVTGIQLTESIPAGLTLLGNAPTQGTYNGGTGVWSVGDLGPGGIATLVLTTRVDAGTAGQTLTHGGTLTASDPADLFNDNNTDSAAVTIQLADLELTLRVDDATPLENELVTFTVSIGNRGPHPASAIKARATLPAGLNYLTSQTSTGTFSPGTGIWSIDSIAANRSPVTLSIIATPGSGTVDSLLTTTAALVDADQADTNPSNDSAAVVIRPQRSGARFVMGTYVGNGQATHPITGVGFQPDLLIIKGTNTAAAVARTKAMPTDAVKELGLASAVQTGRVLSLDIEGFTVGSDVGVNQFGVTYYWTAFLETPGQMEVGSYTGNSTDNRSLTGIGFQPGYMMVMGSGATSAVQRYAAEAGDASLFFQTGAEVTDRIQSLESDGFQVGSSNEVNAASATYYYAAWNGSFDRVQSGVYIGSGQDDRAVTGVGFRPSHLMVKRRDNSPTLERSASMGNDVTLPVGPGFAVANAIQSFVADGFQVGSDGIVNRSGSVYYYVAFRDLPSLDLAVTQTVSDSLPDEGETVTFTVKVQNNGPEEATGVSLKNTLPPELIYQTHVPSRGVYDSQAGNWNIGSIVDGDSATLAITVLVGPGTGGRVLAHSATIATLDQSDSNTGNDASTAWIRIPIVDVGVRVDVDRRLPREEEFVTYTVTVKNQGPDPASGIVVSDPLPAGLTFSSASPNRGSYDPMGGSWTLGSLARGDSAQLLLSAVVDLGTGGATIFNSASLVATDQADTLLGNQADSISIVVALGPGLQVTASQDTTVARPGQSKARLMAVTLLNSSAEACTLERIVLVNQTTGPGSMAQLDAELGTVAMHLDDGDGVFDPVTDLLVRAGTAANDTVGFDSLGVGIASGTLMQFHVVLDLPNVARDSELLGLGILAPADVKFDRVVTFLNTWPVTPTGRILVDGMSASQIQVHPPSETILDAGSTRQLALDVLLPANGYEADILREIRLSNLGDAVPGDDIEKVEIWGDGSNGTFDGGGPDDFPIGTASWNGSSWSISGLNLPVLPGGRRLFVSVDLHDSATAGHRVQLGLGLEPGGSVRMQSGNDGPLDSLVAGPELIVDPGPSALRLRAFAQSTQTLVPGTPGVSILRFEIENISAEAETLQALAFTNRATGPGTVSQLDAEWLPLQLLVDGSNRASGGFAAQRALFANLDVVIAPGDTLQVEVQSGASTVARDGDLLDLMIGSEADLTFNRQVRLLASWPLSPEGNFPVDGMSAAQVQVGTQVASEILTASNRNLALEIVVPGNGYTSDVLQFLLVRNLGSAVPLTDITRLEAWSDDGDGTFDPQGASPDRLLGEMSFTGGDWALGGFSAAVPDSGLRVFFSCDIARDAFEGRTLRLVVPSTPIPGIGMVSGNDGPRDLPVESPDSTTLKTVDHVTWAAQPIAPATAAPGDTGVALLHLSVRNTYLDSTRTLTALRVTNLTSGAAGATRAELDGEIQSLELRTENGTIAQSFFSLGQAMFTGFALPFAPGESHDLRVVARLSVDAAADGDILRASVQLESDLTFGEATSLAGRFPLNSGGGVSVDGMTSRQLRTHAARDTTLGPDEGPVLALDWVVPRNGYADDVLQRVELANAGAAGGADLADVHLWRDGGNGALDRGSVDDEDLGSLAFGAGRWVSGALSEPIGASGLRLFATVATSPNPTDSAIVRLSVPLLGIQVASGNDGPRDQQVNGPTAILLSRSRLLATIEIEPSESVTGDTVTALMTVRNTGSVEIRGVRPTALQLSGAGTIDSARRAGSPIRSTSPPEPRRLSRGRCGQAPRESSRPQAQLPGSSKERASSTVRCRSTAPIASSRRRHRSVSSSSSRCRSRSRADRPMSFL